MGMQLVKRQNIMYSNIYDFSSTFYNNDYCNFKVVIRVNNSLGSLL